MLQIENYVQVKFKNKGRDREKMSHECVRPVRYCSVRVGCAVGDTEEGGVRTVQPYARGGGAGPSQSSLARVACTSLARRWSCARHSFSVLDVVVGGRVLGVAGGGLVRQVSVTRCSAFWRARCWSRSCRRWAALEPARCAGGGCAVGAAQVQRRLVRFGLLLAVRSAAPLC